MAGFSHKYRVGYTVTVYEELPDDEDFAELEDIFNGSDPEKDFCCVKRPFLYSNFELEFLPLAEDDEVPATVIFEKDGIPYINDNACNRDESTRERLDSNFARLVESVVFRNRLP